MSLLLIVISLFNCVRNTWGTLIGTSDLTWAAPLVNLGWAVGFFLAAGSMVSTGRFRWFWPLSYLALFGFFRLMD